jgi:gliding motility-associated lipoprotein GldH
MKSIFSAIAFVSLVLLCSCNKQVIFDKNLIINNESWEYNDAKTFRVLVEDTSWRYNLLINVRHSFHFEWRNLWVNIETIFPDGKKLSKRVNLTLCEADGKWYGKCFNSRCFIRIPIQENAIFPLRGEYIFTMYQDMRVNPLKHIQSIGMRVEKAPAIVREN